jgi:archaellum component FlaF (FlaF/FlaG flagellin family)
MLKNRAFSIPEVLISASIMLSTILLLSLAAKHVKVGMQKTSEKIKASEILEYAVEANKYEEEYVDFKIYISSQARSVKISIMKNGNEDEEPLAEATLVK